MPDYSRAPIYFTDTPMFQNWLKAKEYAWPPASAATFREREDREREFWRESRERRDAQSFP